MKHFEIYKKDPATGALYPEGQRRKKGLARILEIVVRDFWQLLGSGLIATAAALPYGLCIMLFLPSNALGPLILSCVVTGALASVFGMNLLDTILRCLRRGRFLVFPIQKVSEEQHPAGRFCSGAVFGPLFAVDLAGLSLAVRRGQSVFQVEFLVISIILPAGLCAEPCHPDPPDAAPCISTAQKCLSAVSGQPWALADGCCRIDRLCCTVCSAASYFVIPAHRLQPVAADADSSISALWLC